jgi:hypothetical protein
LSQEQEYGSIKPVPGYLPWDQAGRSASTEFRLGGMIMLPCALAAATIEHRRAARIMGGGGGDRSGDCTRAAVALAIALGCRLLIARFSVSWFQCDVVQQKGGRQSS